MSVLFHYYLCGRKAAEWLIVMKRWFRSFLIIAFLCPCYLLTACSMEIPRSSIESTSEQTTESAAEQGDAVDSLEIPSSLDITQTPSHFEPETSGEIDFRYIYRGFTAVPLNNREMFEKFMEFGEQTIATEEEWNAFMASYCPGIPYDEPWNFSEDYLVASIVLGARPTYANSNTITRLIWENGRFMPEFENDPANYVYALNSGEYTHFYVEVIAISRENHVDEGEENQGTAPEKAEIKPIEGDFRTVYRGFTMVPLDDRDTFEDFSEFGTKIISTEEDWNAFMASFCPGMPYYEPWDFSKECIIASVMLGARPTYAGSSRIVGIDQENGFPVFEDDLTNRIYALNTENHTHFYVEIIAIARTELPDNTDTWTYHS